MSKPTCDIMRDWASAYGAAVQQRIVRQETTMAKAWWEANQDEEHAQESKGPGEDSQTEEQAIVESGSESGYDESSDEADEGASAESGNYFQGEIGSSTTFLLGVRSRFGRAIPNNRLIQWNVFRLPPFWKFYNITLIQYESFKILLRSKKLSAEVYWCHDTCY